MPRAILHLPFLLWYSMKAALAGKKLTKRLYKLIAASAKGRTLRRGIKEVVKAVRKNQTGYVQRRIV